MTNSKLTQWLEDDDYFSKLAVFSLGPLHPFAAKANESLVELAQAKGGGVLEVGMGTGWTHRYLSSNHISVFSIEKNGFMVDAALRNGADPNRIAHQSIEDWVSEASNQSFGTVCFQAVLGFTQRPLEILNLCLEKSGAQAVHIVDWHPESKRDLSAHIRPSALSEILSVLENHGLTFVHVETRDYVSHSEELSMREAVERVLVHFPEAREWNCDERIVERARDLVDTGIPKRAFVINAYR
ncbi:class I SAM-dependent methyltransferase [Cribrihabitans sp. XS_ASV171]